MSEQFGGAYIEIGAEIARGEPKRTLKELQARIRKGDVKVDLAIREASINKAITAARRNLKEKADRLTVDFAARIKGPTEKAVRDAHRAAQQSAKMSVKPIQFPAEVSAKQAVVSKARRILQNYADVTPIDFPARLDTKGLARSVERAERTVGDIAMDVTVDERGVGAAAQRIKEKVEDIDPKVDAEVEADTALAAASIFYLARDRFVNIIPVVPIAAAAGVSTALAALSGGRGISNMFNRIKNSIMNMDQALPTIGLVASAITGISGAATAGIGGLMSMGSALASIGSISLALPGLLAGFAIGIPTLVMGFSDLAEKLDDLGPRFTNIKRIIGDNFSDVAEGPVRDMLNGWLPSLTRGFGRVSTEMGGFVASMANALGSEQNIGFLDGIFANTADSIDIAAEGIASFVDAIMNLTNAGSTYLPTLATWFNTIAERFNEWVIASTESGELWEWIDEGIQALQDLGRVIWGIGGVFSNIASAANAAGGGGLKGMGDALERINKTMEGPAFQGAMTTVFEGAGELMDNLGPGVGRLGDTFVKLAPIIREVFGMVGTIGSTAFTLLSDALESPGFSSGVITFFEGIQSALDGLAPAAPAIGEAFGRMASFAGTLASVLGPVLGAAIIALEPVLDSVLDAVEPVAEVLGGVLLDAIETLSPIVQDLAQTFSEFVQENPELVAIVAGLAAALGLVIGGAIGVVTALAPVVTAIAGIAGALSGVSFGALLASAGAVIGPVLAVVAVIAAIGAALVYAWQTSETFRDAVMDLGTAVMGFFQPIIEFVQTTVLPVLMQIGEAIMGAVKTVMDALTPMLTVIVQIITQIIENATPLVEFILGILAPIFTFLGDVISAAFTLIGDIIASVINIITGILNVFLELLEGDFGGAWQKLQELVGIVWDEIGNIISSVVEFIKTTVSSWLTGLQAMWGGVWNWVVTNIRAAWNKIWSTIVDFVVRLVARIVQFVTDVKTNIQTGFNDARARAVEAFVTLVQRVREKIDELVGKVRTFVTNVKDRIRDGFNEAKNTAIEKFQQLRDGVQDKINALLDRIKALPDDIKTKLGNLGGLLKQAGKDLIQGLIDGIGSMGTALRNKAGEMANGAVDSIKNKLGIASPSKVMHEIGQWTGEGFANGISAEQRRVGGAMARLVDVPSPARLRVPVEPSASARAAGEPVRAGGSIVVQVTSPETADPAVWAHRVGETIDVLGLLEEVRA